MNSPEAFADNLIGARTPKHCEKEANAKINTDRACQDRLQSFGIISTRLRNDGYVKIIQNEIARYGKIALENDIPIN